MDYAEMLGKTWLAPGEDGNIASIEVSTGTLMEWTECAEQMRPMGLMEQIKLKY